MSHYQKVHKDKTTQRTFAEIGLQDTSFSREREHSLKLGLKNANFMGSFT
jgi:hypothetical protein